LQEELDEDRDAVDPAVMADVHQCLTESKALSISTLQHPRNQIALSLLQFVLEGQVQLFAGSMYTVSE
jgi:hypothetical protein